MTKSEDNARSKELLLAAIDQKIVTYLANNAETPEIRVSMVMNRNRIAKFLGLPPEAFRKEKK